MDRNFIDKSRFLYQSERDECEPPSEVGCYSRDKNNEFRDDDSSLKIFRPPSDWQHCEFNLRNGFDRMVEPTFSPDTERHRRYSLFNWIMRHEQVFYLDENPVFSRLNTDFVCGRGSLTDLLCAPYQSRVETEKGVKIIRFRGTYYIVDYGTWEEGAAKFSDEDKEIATFWGPKFEQYVTSDQDSTVPDTDQPVNTNEAFYSVVRARLGSHSLVFASAVDCKDNATNTYRELKTAPLLETRTAQQINNFWRYKVLHWWAQAVLPGVPSVVCGFRDDAGIVSSMKEFPVEGLPKMAAANIPNPWKPNVCLGFLDAFLKHVKDVITEDNEKRVYIFKWGPDSKVVSHFKKEDTEENFLPDCFVNWDAWDKTI